MTKAESIARIESRFRSYFTKLPHPLAVFVYSNGRKYFLSCLSSEVASNSIPIESRIKKKLWDITFGNSIFNAAGIFKKGEGYHLCASQGAAAYLAGTTTDSPRHGNSKRGILHPFAPYPQSGAAINWMGLPNEGHETVAKRLSQILPVHGCPVGASVSANPEKSGISSLQGLVRGMELYLLAGVNFIELNESCPNVPHEVDIDNSTGLDRHLLARLEYISMHFLSKRPRNLPVIVKFSNDTDVQAIPKLVNTLAELGFDGINIGNTSVAYNECKSFIKTSEQPLFEYFTNTFGGGVSGKPLKEKSLTLASEAARHVRQSNLPREFHVIRTGGIDNTEDIKKSESAGISLNQWFTGYFEGFARYGHKVYEAICQE